MFSGAAFFELGKCRMQGRVCSHITHLALSVVLALTLLHGYMVRQSGLRTGGKVVTAVTRGNVVYTLSIFRA